MTHRIISADVMDGLGQLDAQSVQTCITSPPYWGLRDYGVDGQIGLEPTIDEYIERMVGVFRAVRRVLRDDGTLWVNMGDGYSTGTNADRPSATTTEGDHVPAGWSGRCQTTRRAAVGLKTKDLIGQPWRLAFALQADGWYLRSDIIWHKPNPMPESVTDRPTKSHEYIFLMSKQPRYFYDADAVREGATCDRIRGPASHPCKDTNGNTGLARRESGGVRNARTVWTIPTQPYPDAHFATFPEALPMRCIKAGTSARGCCPTCGAPWEREVERGELTADCERGRHGYSPSKHDDTGLVMASARNAGGHRPGMSYQTTTTGWRPTCDHDAEPIPCTVLDPFSGSGTTGAVAVQMGREYVGIEINPEYARLSETRIGLACGMPPQEDGTVAGTLFE